jgi:hypothetical protein
MLTHCESQKPLITPAIAAICDSLLPLANQTMKKETFYNLRVKLGAQPLPLTSSPDFNNSLYFHFFNSISK